MNAPPQGHAIDGIDHAVVAVADLEAARERYQRLGFAITPRRRMVEWGTANYSVMFPHGFIELLGIIDPTRFLTPGLEDHLAVGEGTMAVTLGRYLHFQTTLWYREPALGQMPVDIPLGDDFLDGYTSFGISSTTTLPEPDSGFMLLSESRRLRSDEIHYLDHPKIGIVVRIDSVTIPRELARRFEALEEADE